MTQSAETPTTGPTNCSATDGTQSRQTCVHGSARSKTDQGVGESFANGVSRGFIIASPYGCAAGEALR
jgi:hypothetical protein